MLKTILGSKLEMSQTYVSDTRIPVTYIKVGPCVITQVKDDKKDGYFALQLGFGERKTKNIKKPILGHLKGAVKNNKAPYFLSEVKFIKEPDLKVGDIVTVSDVIKKGDLVTVTGVSKGKGFAGGVKRWGFAGGPKTHGQSDRLRAPGSIGQGTTPGRVWKGKKMAGRMGFETTTIKNLIVVEVDSENSKIAVSGPVPGNKNSLLIIKKVGSGKLSELVEETPQVQVQQEEVADENKQSNDKSAKVNEESKED